MEPFSTSHNPKYYLILLRRWVWLLVLASFGSAAVAYLLTARATPVYEASTTLLVSEASTSSTDDYSSVRANERLTLTYSQLMTNDPVIEGVIERLGLGLSADKLANSITVRPVPDTQLILAKVRDTDPDRAALIANTLAAIFVEQNQASQISRYVQIETNLEAQLAEVNAQIQQTASALNQLSDIQDNKPERDRLETFLAQYRQTYASLFLKYEEVRLAEAQSTSNVQSVQAARPPSKPVYPKMLINIAVAWMCGLMSGALVVYVLESLDDSVRDPAGILKDLRLPVLGMIISHKVENQGPISAFEPRSPVAEAFRSLRTSLQFAGADRPIKSILLTSSSPAEGKSLVAANLAVVLAQSNQQVILVDADLRRPTIHKIFATHNRRGLSNLLYPTRDDRDLEKRLAGSLQTTTIQGLKVLTSGRLPPNPAERLGSQEMAALLDLLRQNADFIVIDSPPLLAVTDAAVIAPRLDGTLLLVKPGATQLAAAKDASDQLHQVGANLLGVVLNDIDLSRSSYYYHKYRSYYYDYNGQNFESPPPSKQVPPNLKARSKS